MSDLDTSLDRQQQVRVFEFFNQAAAAGKVVYQLPARLPISLDVVITGTATVNIYRSNLTDDPTQAAMWGERLSQYTASAKMIIEDEPWRYWMVEIAPGIAGTASVAMGV